MTTLTDLTVELEETWMSTDELRLWKTLIQYLQEKEDRESGARERDCEECSGEFVSKDPVVKGVVHQRYHTRTWDSD